MHRSSTAIMLAIATGFLTAASADEARPFGGFRALVVAPGQVWQEWDSAIYGALEERGFEVTYVLDLPDEIQARLRARAARAGRSVEAEARAILTAAYLSEQPTRPTSDLPEWVDRLYEGQTPRGVVDTLIAERRGEGATD